MAGISILLVICFFAVRINIIPESIFSGKHAVENINMMRDLATTELNFMSIIILAIPIIASIIFWRIKNQSPYKLVLSTLGIVWGIFISLDGFYQPVILSSKSDYNVAMQIKRLYQVAEYIHIEQTLLLETVCTRSQ